MFYSVCSFPLPLWLLSKKKDPDHLGLSLAVWRTKRSRVHLRTHKVLLKGVYDGRVGQSIYWRGWQEEHRKASSVPLEGLEGFRTEWISFNVPVGQKL